MMHFEEMAEIKQEVDDEDEHNPQSEVPDMTVKSEPDFEADGSYGHTESLSVKGRVHVSKRTGPLRRCAAGRPCAYLQDPDISEEGNIGITVMEQDTNGAMVMVLRSEQFCTSSDVSDHPVVRPTGAGVSKRQDDDQVPTQPQEVFSQTDKSALSIGVEAVGNIGTELLGDCAAGQGDVCQKEEDISEEGNIGITVMEQDTNGAMVMVLRSEQFCTSSDVSDHPVVRPTGAGVSKRQDDDQVPTQPQEVFSQTDKSALSIGVEAVGNIGTELLGDCAAGQADVCQKEEEVQHEEGNIGITVMEQDTNGTMVMVLRSEQFCTSSDVSDHPVVRPTGAGVSKRQDDDQVNTEPQDVSSQADKSAGLCEDGFTSDEEIVQEDVKPYLCGVCDMCFTDISDLNKHTRQHTEEEPYMDDAGITHDSDVKDENTQSEETAYKCHVCGLEFTNSKFLAQHEKRHSEGDDCKCCDCGLKLTYCKCLKAESLDRSGDGDERPTDHSDLPAQQTPSAGDKRYSCDSCDLEFKVARDLKIHKRTHTGEKPYSCDICGMRFTNTLSLAGHHTSHTGDRAYKCDFCGLGFAYKSHLKRHVMIHTGDRPYKCGVCGTKFTRSFSLKIHERIHTGHKPYKCDICGQEFTNNGCLKRHAGTHSGEKPYKCDICDVRYAFRSYLKIHKRTHTGEKPFKCDVCGLEFTDNRCLKRHTGIHTGIPRKLYGGARSGEKPYKCDICDAKFAFQRYLKVHERIHTGEKPYKCELCDSRFSHVHTMKEHQRIHTGEKPYICHICNIGFTYKSHLTRHVITHTGERPYKCDICGITFTQSSSLNRHKGVHKEKVVV